MNNAECCVGEGLKLASGEVFFAQLNKVNSATSCLCDLLKHSPLAGVFLTGKQDAIGDVVEQQAFYGLVLAISAFVLAFFSAI